MTSFMAVRRVLKGPWSVMTAVKHLRMTHTVATTADAVIRRLLTGFGWRFTAPKLRVAPGRLITAVKRFRMTHTVATMADAVIR